MCQYCCIIYITKILHNSFQKSYFFAISHLLPNKFNLHFNSPSTENYVLLLCFINFIKASISSSYWSITLTRRESLQLFCSSIMKSVTLYSWWRPQPFYINEQKIDEVKKLVFVCPKTSQSIVHLKKHCWLLALLKRRNSFLWSVWWAIQLHFAMITIRIKISSFSSSSRQFPPSVHSCPGPYQHH